MNENLLLELEWVRMAERSKGYRSELEKVKRRLEAAGLIHDCLICPIFATASREKRANMVVAGCEVAVRAGGRQEGARGIRLGAFRLHFCLLCLVTVVLEPDLDLCGAMRLSFASQVLSFFLEILEVINSSPKMRRTAKFNPFAISSPSPHVDDQHHLPITIFT